MFLASQWAPIWADIGWLTDGGIDGTLATTNAGDTLAGIGTIAQPQRLRPDGDTAVGAWLTSSGSGTLSSHVDEAVANDADFIYTETPSSAARISLDPGGDPLSSDNHVLRYRARHGAVAASVRMGLYQGTTLIAQWDQALTASWTEYQHTLSAGEADAITDYAALEVRPMLLP